MTALAVLSVSTLCVGAAGVAAGAEPTASSQPPIKPPVIRESFTLLPCNKKTTIGMEGCEEHQLFAADIRIDREVSVLFTLLDDNAARLRLSQAESAWLAYRKADCLSQSDIFQGESEAAVEDAACAVSDDKARSSDLHRFYEGLAQGRQHPPAFP